MKRNPFLLVLVILIAAGVLFFRYASPSQSHRMKEMAEQLQDKAGELVADASMPRNGGETQLQQQDTELKAEEARIVAEQKEGIKPVNLLELGTAPAADPGVLSAASVPAESDESEAENAMKRANELLAQAMKAADEAKAQIRMAQKQLDREMRARPNMALLAKSAPQKAAAAPAEKKAAVKEQNVKEQSVPAPKTVIAPNAPLTEIEKIFAESTIRFDWTRSILNDDAQGKIDSIVKTLKLNPEISLRVIGHTDANGTEELNNWLGLIRARRVRQQLIAKGINPKRISVSSQGSKDPIESNDTANGRWKNRRVEFAVSEK